MAVSVSEGSRFLGRRTTQGTVLYLSYDDNVNRIAHRLQEMDCKDNAPLLFDFDPESKTVEEEFPALICQTKEAHPDLLLVVVDVLTYIKGEKNSTYNNDYDFMKKLKSIAEEYNICISLVTHVTKDIKSSDPFRSICGSVGLTGASDGYIVLTADNDSGVCTLHAKGNDINSFSEKVEFDQYSLKWERYCFQSEKEGTDKETFLSALYFYLTNVETEFNGTMSELIDKLGSAVKTEIDPIAAGRYLKQSKKELSYCGIEFTTKRTAEARTYHITYDPGKDNYAKSHPKTTELAVKTA